MPLVQHPKSKIDKPWDHIFRDWIRKAQQAGQDPNDLGDIAWSDDPLRETLNRHYLPYVRPESTLLELGPGTGRLTRHLIAQCQKMILVDYSQEVCDWLGVYLTGKGNFSIHLIQDPSLPMVADKTIDFIVANGVFEHIRTNDFFLFFREFLRVLKPGGVASLNFDNLMSDGGRQWLKFYQNELHTAGAFQFHHPASICSLAELLGFEVLRLTTSSNRFAHIEIRKPSQDGPTTA